MEKRQGRPKELPDLQQPWLAVGLRSIQQKEKYIKSLQLRQDKKHQNIDFNSKQVYSVVGVLWSSWQNNNKKVIAKNVGTAFALTPRLLATCTHNTYSRKIVNSYASYVDFYPNVQSINSINQNTPKYRGTVVSPRVNLENVNFETQPIPEQLTLILLEEELQGVSWFPSVGCIQSIAPQPEGQQLRIIGYPFLMNQVYGKGYQMSDTIRKDHRGQMDSIKAHTIQYYINTCRGQSGSPVMVQNADGEPVVVGIHTHAGMKAGVNVGLAFTMPILEELKKIESIAFEKTQNSNKIKFYVPPTPYKLEKVMDVNKEKSEYKMKILPYDSLVRSIMEMKSITRKLDELQIEDYHEEKPQNNEENELQSNKSQISIYDELIFQIDERRKLSRCESDSSEQVERR